MQRFAGILLQVGVVDTYPLALAVVELNVHMARADNRFCQLRGLIALGQVRVEVVLALEHRGAGNLRVDRQPEHHRVTEGILIGHRQGAGHGQVQGAGLGVGRGAEGCAGAGEQLAPGGELDVDFEADHGFPGHAASSSAGVRSCQSVASWNRWATLSMRSSLK